MDALTLTQKAILLVTATALVCFCNSAFATTIAGSDFDDSPTFNGGGSLSATTDDLNVADNITVSGWSIVGGGAGFHGGFATPTLDGSAQNGMPNSPVIKVDGNAAALPAVGTLPAGLQGVSFDLTIPTTDTLDLTDITWEFRQATGTTSNVRWLAFKTSLDANIIWSEVGLHRNAFDAQTVDLSGAAYQNLSDQTVTFTWYAGGSGSGDIDFDTVVINGTAIVVPEPSTLALLSMGALALLAYAWRRRRGR